MHSLRESRSRTRGGYHLWQLAGQIDQVHRWNQASSAKQRAVSGQIYTALQQYTVWSSTLEMIYYTSWRADLASQFWEMESNLPQDLTFHWCNFMIEMGKKVTFSMSSMVGSKSRPKLMKSHSMPSRLYSSCSSTNMWWLKNCWSFSLVKLMQSCSKVLN